VKGGAFREALLLLAGFAAATAGFAALGPTYGGELRVGLPRLPAEALEPWIPGGAGEPALTRLVHEGLVRTGSEGLPLPGLAARWSAGAGAREWQLELAAGARFHDERPVAAADAVRSLRRFLRGGSPAAARLAGALDGGTAFRRRESEALPGLSEQDEGRLTLRFLEPRPLPLAPLSAPAAAVVSERGQRCGPFVPALAVPGRSVALTAFASHVRGRPHLDRLTLKAADAAATRADLREGRLDVALAEADQSRLAATLMLVLDSSRAPFDRPSARDAVASVVPGAAIAALWHAAEPWPGLLAPSLLPGALELPAAPGTLKGAVALSVAEDVPALVAQRVVASLDVLGLRTRATAVDPAAAPTARGHARLFLWSPEVPEPGLALSELAALAPVSRVALDALVAAEQELDLDRRRGLLREAEAALRADRLLVPLCSVPVSVATRPGVHGVRLDAAGRLVLEDAWVEP
jgi:MarR-like DNA-binding transcriptional regulator SgrR of sgrS sRNA